MAWPASTPSEIGTSMLRRRGTQRLRGRGEERLAGIGRPRACAISADSQWKSAWIDGSMSLTRPGPHRHRQQHDVGGREAGDAEAPQEIVGALAAVLVAIKCLGGPEAGAVERLDKICGPLDGIAYVTATRRRRDWRGLRQRRAWRAAPARWCACSRRTACSRRRASWSAACARTRGLVMLEPANDAQRRSHGLSHTRLRIS